MIKLSVVIITLNEEKNIGRCIDSVIDFADDIVIVDSFSTDRTEEISITKGARVIKQKFLGHIEQKNFAITQAKYPYILSLDADEAPSEELKKSIINAKNDWNFDGYKMNRLSNYCGKWIKHSGWYPDTKLRLWDSRKGEWGGVNPHDKFEMTRDSKIQHLKGDLYHYTYYKISEHKKQADKFSTIAAKALHAKSKKSNWIKVLLKPFFKFIRNYIIKMGFLDGYYGFVICKISAWETYMKYKKLIKIK